MSGLFHWLQFFQLFFSFLYSFHLVNCAGVQQSEIDLNRALTNIVKEAHRQHETQYFAKYDAGDNVDGQKQEQPLDSTTTELIIYFRSDFNKKIISQADLHERVELLNLLHLNVLIWMYKENVRHMINFALRKKMLAAGKLKYFIEAQQKLLAGIETDDKEMKLEKICKFHELAWEVVNQCSARREDVGGAAEEEETLISGGEKLGNEWTEMRTQQSQNAMQQFIFALERLKIPHVGCNNNFPQYLEAFYMAHLHLGQMEQIHFYHFVHHGKNYSAFMQLFVSEECAALKYKFDPIIGAKLLLDLTLHFPDILRIDEMTDNEALYLYRQILMAQSANEPQVMNARKRLLLSRLWSRMRFVEWVWHEQLQGRDIPVEQVIYEKVLLLRNGVMSEKGEQLLDSRSLCTMYRFLYTISPAIKGHVYSRISFPMNPEMNEDAAFKKAKAWNGDECILTTFQNQIMQEQISTFANEHWKFVQKFESTFKEMISDKNGLRTRMRLLIPEFYKYSQFKIEKLFDEPERQEEHFRQAIGEKSSKLEFLAHKLGIDFFSWVHWIEEKLDASKTGGNGPNNGLMVFEEIWKDNKDAALSNLYDAIFDIDDMEKMKNYAQMVGQIWAGIKLLMEKIEKVEIDEIGKVIKTAEYSGRFAKIISEDWNKIQMDKAMWKETRRMNKSFIKIRNGLWIRGRINHMNLEEIKLSNDTEMRVKEIVGWNPVCREILERLKMEITGDENYDLDEASEAALKKEIKEEAKKRGKNEKYKQRKDKQQQISERTKMWEGNVLESVDGGHKDGGSLDREERTPLYGRSADKSVEEEELKEEEEKQEERHPEEEEFGVDNVNIWREDDDEGDQQGTWLTPKQKHHHHRLFRNKSDKWESERKSSNSSSSSPRRKYHQQKLDRTKSVGDKWEFGSDDAAGGSNSPSNTPPRALFNFPLQWPSLQSSSPRAQLKQDSVDSLMPSKFLQDNILSNYIGNVRSAEQSDGQVSLLEIGYLVKAIQRTFEMVERRKDAQLRWPYLFQSTKWKWNEMQQKLEAKVENGEEVDRLKEKLIELRDELNNHIVSEPKEDEEEEMEGEKLSTKMLEEVLNEYGFGGMMEPKEGEMVENVEQQSKTMKRSVAVEYAIRTVKNRITGKRMPSEERKYFLIGGSHMYNAHSTNSDIDCLVLYEPIHRSWDGTDPSESLFFGEDAKCDYKRRTCIVMWYNQQSGRRPYLENSIFCTLCQLGVKPIRKIRAHVPLLKFAFYAANQKEKVEFDLIFIPMPPGVISSSIEEMGDLENLEKIDQMIGAYVNYYHPKTEISAFKNQIMGRLFALSGYRANLRIRNLLGPFQKKFAQALLALKFWAKRHHIYGGHFGFFNGTMLSIMVCQLLVENSHASVLMLLELFFIKFSAWNGNKPEVVLEKMVNVEKREDEIGTLSPLEQTRWWIDWKRKNEASQRAISYFGRGEWLSQYGELAWLIITPGFPTQNCAYNVHKMTAEIIKRAMKQSLNSIISIQQKATTQQSQMMTTKSAQKEWEIFFEGGKFQEKFVNFLLISCQYRPLFDYGAPFCEFAETRFRQELLFTLGKLAKELNLFYHILPQKMVKDEWCRSQEGKSGWKCSEWLVGIGRTNYGIKKKQQKSKMGPIKELMNDGPYGKELDRMIANFGKQIIVDFKRKEAIKDGAGSSTQQQAHDLDIVMERK